MIKGYLNVREVASVLELPVHSVRLRARKHEFPNIKRIGTNSYLFPVKDVQAVYKDRKKRGLI